jgi:hypothetical protein
MRPFLSTTTATASILRPSHFALLCDFLADFSAELKIAALGIEFSEHNFALSHYA